MNNESQKKVLIGLLIASFLIFFQFFLPFLRGDVLRTPSPPLAFIKEPSPSAIPALRAPKVDSAFDVREQKTATITEKELNSRLPSLQESSNISLSEASINVTKQELTLRLTTVSNQSIRISASPTDDGRDLKVSSYDFSGFSNFTDEVEVQFSKILLDGVKVLITRDLEGHALSSISLDNDKVIIVYY